MKHFEPPPPPKLWARRTFCFAAFGAASGTASAGAAAATRAATDGGGAGTGSGTGAGASANAATAADDVMRESEGELARSCSSCAVSGDGS